jgi:lipopolysaccharide/colanic/teichoic acid biosynthesis glycosyltransferase
LTQPPADPSDLHKVPIVLDYSPGTNGFHLVAKRTCDIVGSAALIWLALPLMSIIAVAIAATSPGPVLFRQTCLGKGCVPFVFYRFRPIGEFIRRTSLDELPQLFNVLKGDMSFVGPRPPLSSEAAKYDPVHLKRMLEVKPGITGPWQVESRRRDPR